MTQQFSKADIEGVVERLQKIVDIQPEWATAYKVCTEAIAALTYLAGENERLEGALNALIVAVDWEVPIIESEIGMNKNLNILQKCSAEARQALKGESNENN